MQGREGTINVFGFVDVVALALSLCPMFRQYRRPLVLCSSTATKKRCLPAPGSTSVGQTSLFTEITARINQTMYAVDLQGHWTRCVACIPGES